MKRTFFGALAAVLILGSAQCASGGHHVHWGYEGHEGPEHWGELAGEFSACKAGSVQSPINIESKTAVKGDLKPIEFHYQKMTNPEVINNGHTIQVNYAPGSYAVIGGKKYNLLQFHFHAPSEESIDGRHGDLNVHLVHKSDDGKLAVVGVLMYKGAENAALKSIAGSFPAALGKQAAAGDLNAADLLPADQAYFNFEGSLTTPPCTEGVNWNVMRNPVTLSEGQLKAYTAVYKNTARPTQPTHNRKITSSK